MKEHLPVVLLFVIIFSLFITLFNDWRMDQTKEQRIKSLERLVSKQEEVLAKQRELIELLEMARGKA